MAALFEDQSAISGITVDHPSNRAENFRLVGGHISSGVIYSPIGSDARVSCSFAYEIPIVIAEQAFLRVPHKGRWWISTLSAVRV
jgi:hypothetical protein